MLHIPSSFTAAPEFPPFFVCGNESAQTNCEVGGAAGFQKFPPPRRSYVACALVWSSASVESWGARSCEIEAGSSRIGGRGAQCRVGRDGGGGAMARGIARAVSFGGRATTGWCSYRRVTVAVCLGNLVAALLVLRSLTAPASFAPAAPNREWNPSPCLHLRFSFCESDWVLFDLFFRRGSGAVYGGAD